MALCASTLHVHVPIFPFFQRIITTLVRELLLMTFSSCIVFSHTHELPPKTSVWRTAILHGIRDLLETSMWIVSLPHGSMPPQVTFVSLIAALLALLLPLWPSDVTQKLPLLDNIKLRRGLCHLPYIPLWPLTRSFTMLKVHSRLCSTSGYHSYINLIILFIIPTWLSSHYVAMCLLLFPLL
jgi:hypothetical protein